jgi:GR25 family glycosyltransferase involved in LPS biosynthesis
MRQLLVMCLLACIGLWCNAAAGVAFKENTHNHKLDHHSHPEMVDTSGPLLTMWVNLNTSIDITIATKDSFTTISHKYNNALNMIQLTALRLNEASHKVLRNMKLRVRIVNSFKEHIDLHGSRMTYLTSEVAATLSHIQAITTAYEKGAHIALVIEDGFAITDKFIKNWRRYVSLAPLDWEVLQLYCNNSAIIKLSGRVERDGFTQWMGDHYSTGAYLINRAGMKTLLDVSGAVPGTVTLPGRIIVSDEFVYFHTVSYTALDPMISVLHPGGAESLTAIDRLYEEAYSKKLSISYPDNAELSASAPRLLIITVTLVAHLNETQSTATLILRNLAEVTRHAKVKYALLVLIRSEHMRQPVLDAFRKVHHSYKDSFVLSTKVVHERFNKFRFVNTFVSEMGDYEYVLLADSDIPLSGYPWEELFKSSRDAGAVVTGTAREGRHAKLIKNFYLIVRTPFRMFDGSWWKHRANQAIDYVYVDFIEQYFTLLNGQFAQWFFTPFLSSDLWLTEQGVPTISDWGPDLGWCGAASQWIKEYNKKNISLSHLREPCVLVSLVITHSDTKQITNNNDVEDRNHLRKISTYNGGSWWEYSKACRAYIDQNQFKDLKDLKTINFTDYYHGLELLKGSPAAHWLV